MADISTRWQLFLKDLAIKSELTKQEIKVFLYQFDLLREHWSISEISTSIFPDVGIGKESYRQGISKVYAGLSNLGLDFEDRQIIDSINERLTDLRLDSAYIKFEPEKARGERVDIAWRWLKQKFIHWDEEHFGRSALGIEALWNQLKELGQYAPHRMGVNFAENSIEKAGALKSSQPKPFLQSVPKDTDGLKFKLIGEGMGQVLLLNRDHTNVVYCTCPSLQAPNINLRGGEMIVPQPDSPYADLAAEPGNEEWWGWIVDKLPPISWLGAKQNEEAPQVNAAQLAELLTHVELYKGEVLHTRYLVH